MPQTVTLSWEEYTKLAGIDFEYVSGLEDKLAYANATVEDFKVTLDEQTNEREDLEMAIRDQSREIRDLDETIFKLREAERQLQIRLANALADAAEWKVENERLKRLNVQLDKDLKFVRESKPPVFDPNKFGTGGIFTTTDADKLITWNDAKPGDVDFYGSGAPCGY